jgi:tripartite-type tricarboxylate transporter receptor subunit TctC
VLAQSWPQKPVRFIVPFPPGGATDISARLVGEKLSQIWGQTVVIENRGGAGGGVGAAEAARATPDGYTLFFPSGSVVTANQHVYAKLAYDPDKDFVPITKVVAGPQVLTVAASSPFKTVKELIDYARANPGKVTFGHAGIGSQTHLAAENFVWQAKIDALAVPYKGEGPGLAASLSGETTFFLGNVAAAIGHIQGGCARSASPARARRRSFPACRRSARPSRASRTPAGSAWSRPPARRRTSCRRCMSTRRRRSRRATCAGGSTCRGWRRSAIRPSRWRAR